MKQITIVFLTLAIGMAVSSGARAQQTSPMDRPGLDIGVRLGFALPFGKVYGSNGGSGSPSLGDGFSGAIPLVLEAGLRINADFTVGALFQYAFGLTKNCDAGASCSGSVVRLGIEGLYRIQNPGPLIPWLGLGAGYEWLSLSESSGTTVTGGSGGFSGFEFVTVQVGGDYRFDPHFSLGPFVSFSLALYDTASAEYLGTSRSADIPNTTLHEWLQLGLKGTFSL